MQKRLFLIPLGILLMYLFSPKPAANWVGELAPGHPIQSMDDLPSAWTRGAYTFAPKARYEMRAVVLSKQHYWLDVEDKVAPYDLALGWGPMSDASVINALKISQSGRWFNYSWKENPPIAQQEIVTHSANNHIIARDQNILRQIKAIKRFDIVFLKGYLVNVMRPDGWRWQTSLTREDSGAWACEIFWVESVQKIVRP